MNELFNLDNVLHRFRMTLVIENTRKIDCRLLNKHKEES